MKNTPKDREVQVYKRQLQVRIDSIARGNNTTRQLDRKRGTNYEGWTPIGKMD